MIYGAKGSYGHLVGVFGLSPVVQSLFIVSLLFLSFTLYPLPFVLPCLGLRAWETQVAPKYKLQVWLK